MPRTNVNRLGFVDLMTVAKLIRSHAKIEGPDSEPKRCTVIYADNWSDVQIAAEAAKQLRKTVTTDQIARFRAKNIGQTRVGRRSAAAEPKSADTKLLVRRQNVIEERLAAVEEYLISKFGYAPPEPDEHTVQPVAEVSLMGAK